MPICRKIYTLLIITPYVCSRIKLYYRYFLKGSLFLFGYVRPWKSALTQHDLELYRSVYCSLCEKLGRDYGFSSRFILSYDAVFLAMMISTLHGEKREASVIEGRCPLNPLKSCVFCEIDDDSAEAAAAFSVIAFYYKLADTAADERLFKSLTARFLKTFFLKKKSRAAGKYPFFDSLLSDMASSQLAAEKDPDCGIDAAADPTAKMLGLLMKSLSDCEEIKDSLFRFGYFLGRWIYLADMTDDLEKDIRSGSFNPLINRFPAKDKLSLKNSETNDYCGKLLKQTMKGIFGFYKEIPSEYSPFKTITDNIVFEGLYNMSRFILEKDKSKKYGKI